MTDTGKSEHVRKLRQRHTVQMDHPSFDEFLSRQCDLVNKSYVTSPSKNISQCAVSVAIAIKHTTERLEFLDKTVQYVRQFQQTVLNEHQ